MPTTKKEGKIMCPENSNKYVLGNDGKSYHDFKGIFKTDLKFIVDSRVSFEVAEASDGGNLWAYGIELIS